MDRYEVKREVERAFARNNKTELYKVMKTEDTSFLIDVLWDYMQETDKGVVAKRELKELREKIVTMNGKSGQRTRCIKLLPKRRALVQFGPLKEEVIIAPNIDITKLKPGTEVLVIGNTEGRVLAEIRKSDLCDGRLSKVCRILDKERVIIEDGGHSLILKLASGVECKEGDEIRYDLEAQMVMEVITSQKNSTYELSEIPNTTFENVKGLEEEKKYLIERIIYPSVHRDKFRKYGIKPIKGAIFHGPPGCGKSLIAGAIFNEMAILRTKLEPTMKAKTNNKGFFLINGPELLEKWAGSTEEKIRNIFNAARKAAIKSDIPSLIFWDEIESITRKRTDSATYTPEKTVIPTLLTELQGVGSKHNVILIGATNRPDLIDPALMRPGRLGDLILEIPKPTKEAALDILNMEFTRGEVPQKLHKLIENDLTEKIVTHIYDNEKPLTIVTLKSGKKVPIMRQEQVNGALFTQLGEEIVRNMCISEIQGTEHITIKDIIELAEKIMLNQIGVLDSGVKSGFMFNTEDYVLDVSLNA